MVVFGFLLRGYPRLAMPALDCRVFVHRVNGCASDLNGCFLKNGRVWVMMMGAITCSITFNQKRQHVSCTEFADLRLDPTNWRFRPFAAVA
jgi:hypothetical protein